MRLQQWLCREASCDDDPWRGEPFILNLQRPESISKAAEHAAAKIIDDERREAPELDLDDINRSLRRIEIRDGDIWRRFEVRCLVKVEYFAEEVS